MLRWALVYFTVCIIFDERWSMCLVGVDIGVDEPALQLYAEHKARHDFILFWLYFSKSVVSHSNRVRIA